MTPFTTFPTVLLTIHWSIIVPFGIKSFARPKNCSIGYNYYKFNLSIWSITSTQVTASVNLRLCSAILVSVHFKIKVSL